jgi:hypothetical protein
MVIRYCHHLLHQDVDAYGLTLCVRLRRTRWCDGRAGGAAPGLGSSGVDAS